jgi:hypothetical protein
VDDEPVNEQQEKRVLVVFFSNEGLFLMRKCADLFIDGTFKVSLKKCKIWYA